MSALDPLARAALDGGAFNPVTAELHALAADAEALTALLKEGDVVSATVLPSNGLTDLVEIGGLRVAAALPPTVRPGDTIILEVSGFEGDRVLVKLIGTDESASALTLRAAAAQYAASLDQGIFPAPSSSPGLSAVPGQPTAPEPPTITTTLPPPSEPTVGPPPIPTAVDAAALVRLADSTIPSAPSRAVFVAASILTPDGKPVPVAPPAGQNATPSARGALANPIGTNPTPANLAAANSTAKVVAAPTPAAGTSASASGRAPIVQPEAGRVATSVPPSAAQSLDARIAAARSGVAPPTSRPTANPEPTLVAPRTFVTIEPRRTIPAPPPAAAAPLGDTRVSATARPTVPVAPAEQTAPPPLPIRAQSLLNDPTGLVRTLRLPVTPLSISFAKLVTSRPEQVAIALRALESALPSGASDARAATLRTLAAFVGALDPKSPTLATQIAAYVEHVVVGPESVLATIARAGSPVAGTSPDAAVPSQPTPQNQGTATGPGAPATSDGRSAAPTSAVNHQIAPGDHRLAGHGATRDPIIAAQVAERASVLGHDLKSTVLALLASGAKLSDAATSALQNAVTGVVANQLTSLAGQQAQPTSWTFIVPIALGDTTVPARVVIEREASPEHSAPLTADDFRIAFILETKRLGTVAVDVHTVGRGVSVAVKAEHARSAASFKSQIANLGERLETMRYSVKALSADVATSAIRGATEPALPSAAPADIDTHDGVLDRRA